MSGRLNCIPVDEPFPEFNSNDVYDDYILVGNFLDQYIGILTVLGAYLPD